MKSHVPKRAAVILGLLLAWGHCAFALDTSLEISQYGHRSWKIRDGFPEGYAEAIAQTPDGYLWIGSEFGLTWFDGVRHIAWHPPANQHPPLGYIRSLLAARDGALWIGTRQGVSRWKDAVLTDYSELGGYDVYSIIEDREGTVWMTGTTVTHQTDRVCSVRATVVQCTTQDDLGGKAPSVAYEDEEGNLWLGLLGGITRLKPQPSVSYEIPLPADPSIPWLSYVTSLVEGKRGELLVGTTNGIYRFSGHTLEAQSIAGRGGDKAVRRLLRDRDGGVWIGTNNGLVHLHDGRTDSYTQADGLSGDEVISLFEDRENNVWVATHDGLDQFRNTAVRTISRAQGLRGFPFSVLAARDGSLWIGTDAGLSKWHDNELNTYRTGRHAATNGPEQSSKSASDNRPREIFDEDLGSDAINALAEDGRGRIWVGNRKGLSVLDNGRFVRVPEVPGGFLHAIVLDDSGGVWISHQTEGLIHLLPQKSIEKFAWSTFGSVEPAVSMLLDPGRGGLWLGFFKGGIAYFEDHKVRASYGQRDGLGSGYVANLFRDNGGALWAAMPGGLSRLDRGRVRTLTSGNGLPCDNVHWVIQDQSYTFWLETACGLVRIERRELAQWASGTTPKVHTTLFDSTDGVRKHASPSVFAPNVTISPDGRLWFLTIDGVSVIDPRNLPFNRLAPPVHIEQIVADRKIYEPTTQLGLPPLVHDLVIDYTALSLVVPEKDVFRYRLEGHDRGWQEVGNRRQAYYSDLPPGTYRFRVIASNNSGVWNEQGATLDFSIAPAYWQTNWFRALCAAAFLGLLWLLYVLRLRQVKQTFNMTLEARVAERTRIARELHDTLLQSFQGLLLRFQTVADLLPARPADAKRIVVSAVDQAAQAITEGRNAVQGLRTPAADSSDLAVELRSLAELVAAETHNENIALSVKIEGNPRSLHSIARDEIYRIAGEALRNAFRHAKPSRIEVELRYDAPQLRLRIGDDGKGIDPKTLSDSDQTHLAGHFGIRGMRERAKLIGAKLTIWSAVGTGTEIELVVPASRVYVRSPRARRSWLADKLSGTSEENVS